MGRKDLNLKSVADLIAYAKANPNKTNLSTTGPASSPAAGGTAGGIE